ncbi:subunit of the Arp2/3 complex [Dimargaris cristalligena]|uniref:Actin-related protein 2/3 complex subunit 3 n=1 Tax=Dimargaris cristalligena TaxID=215637 RepID=A0A4P9ZRN0_9FUNG|nr:subunit of the Arp2/3 complex [Dimargaris cristalligena]RKP35411.1 actin-like protein ARPC3 [Dimargaris cristalligena]|eukprot:RKP35411.1 actin-like protein ARPC3 [Dimargaris cristalligena]
MPAYHSAYNSLTDHRVIGGIPLVPLKTKAKGPAPQAEPSVEDAVDEALDLFRANCLFRNFEIKGPGDRLLIYLILYISECLTKLNRHTSQAEATKALYTLAVSNFSIPGDTSFPLYSLYPTPESKFDTDLLRQYLTQIRQELGQRLVERVYVDGTPSKWWLCFQKRKFMGKSL